MFYFNFFGSAQFNYFILRLCVLALPHASRKGKLREYIGEKPHEGVRGMEYARKMF